MPLPDLVLPRDFLGSRLPAATLSLVRPSPRPSASNRLAQGGEDAAEASQEPVPHRRQGRVRSGRGPCLAALSRRDATGVHQQRESFGWASREPGIRALGRWICLVRRARPTHCAAPPSHRRPRTWRGGLTRLPLLSASSDGNGKLADLYYLLSRAFGIRSVRGSNCGAGKCCLAL